MQSRQKSSTWSWGLSVCLGGARGRPASPLHHPHSTPHPSSNPNLNSPPVCDTVKPQLTPCVSHCHTQDTYFTLMPAYQGLPSLESVKFKRVLFGGFPCYSSTTPLGPGFERVLQLGDASASQSPLSFGGFGSMLRHLGRLSGAVGHALREDRLSKQDLAWVHPYQPSLSAAWLFQRSMSVQVGQTQQQQQSASAAATAADAAPAAAAATAASSSSGQPSSSAWWRQLLLLPASHINALLGANFTAMAILGQRVMKPFLQDTLQVRPACCLL